MQQVRKKGQKDGENYERYLEMAGASFEMVKRLSKKKRKETPPKIHSIMV